MFNIDFYEHVSIVTHILLFFLIPFLVTAVIFFIIYNIKNKPIKYMIAPCILIGLFLSVVLGDICFQLMLYGSIYDRIFACIIGFSQLPSIWFIYAGFKKQIRWKASIGIVWLSFTFLPLISVVDMLCCLASFT